MLLPNTPEILVRKVYGTIAKAFTARGTEVHVLTFENVKMYDAHAIVEYEHVKRTKAKSSDGTSVLINGELEMKALREYFECFEVADRTGMCLCVL